MIRITCGDRGTKSTKAIDVLAEVARVVRRVRESVRAATQGEQADVRGIVDPQNRVAAFDLQAEDGDRLRRVRNLEIRLRHAVLQVELVEIQSLAPSAAVAHEEVPIVRVVREKDVLVRRRSPGGEGGMATDFPWHTLARVMSQRWHRGSVWCPFLSCVDWTGRQGRRAGTAGEARRGGAT